MTDFRAEKASGAKPAKFPDFKCEACGHPKWTTPKPKPPTMPAARPPAGAFTGREPKWTWPTLAETYLQSLLIARKQVVGLATSLELEIRMEDVIAAGATIFIAASRDGVKLQAVSRVPDEEPEDETA